MKHPYRIAGLVGLLALAILLWMRAGRTPPPLPQIPLDGASTEIVDAVNTAKARVSDDPYSADAWGGLGDLLSANGFPTQAIECYSNAAEFDSASPRWHYLQAVENLRSGRSRDAIPLLIRASQHIRTRDEALIVNYDLTIVLIEEGLLDDAGVSLKAFAKLDGENDRTGYLRALLARARGETNDAQRELEQLLHSPRFAKRAHRLLAALSEPGRAQQLIATSETLPPDSPIPNPFTRHLASLRVESTNKLEGYIRLLHQDPDAALEHLRHIAADSTDSEYSSTLGQALMQRGRSREAIEAFRQAIRINPKHALARMMLGDLLELQSHAEPQGNASEKLLDEAFEQVSAALRLQPNLGHAHVVRGRVFMDRKQNAEAIAAFREAVTCQPGIAAMHRELGEALARSGDIAAGVASLETAAMLDPNDERIRAALAKWKR
ncbi:MAG: tetratricopeptide repeat protein [Gemmataceae bacterium]